jgi:glycosyltransferase involved in cell wall biosynthesis
MVRGTLQKKSCNVYRKNQIKLNILIINHYAGGPAYGMEFRPHLLAREWVKLGHKVQVLASGFSHLRSCQPLATGSRGIRDESVDGIDFRWYPTPPYSGNGIARVKNIWSFLSQVWKDSKRIVDSQRPDVVIASSTYPMDFWIARRIARLAASLLVFELHDLWPASLIELGGMSSWHPFALLCGMAERSACRNADVYVSMLPNVHEHVASLGLDLRRLHIIPNGVCAEDWLSEPLPLQADLQSWISQAHNRGDSVLGYAGSMGKPNALDTLLDAANLLRGEKVRILIVGDGYERERLVKRIDDEKLNQVYWVPAVSKKQIPRLIAEWDMCYIGAKKKQIYRFGIAMNKIMDYMMAAKPIVMSIEAGNNPVAEAGSGFSVEAESPEAVANAVRRILGMPVSERHEMGVAGKNYVLENHEWKNLANRFINILTENI